MRFAVTLEPDLAKSFLAAVRALRAPLTEQQVQLWIEQGGANRAATMIMQGFGDKAFQPLAEAALRAATKVADMEAAKAHVLIRFNPENPVVASAIKTQGLAMIREISDTTREGIRGYLDHALRLGINPRDSARDIRGLIGLTERQTRAVANFRRLLMNGDREALTRALRDQRFDRSILGAIEGRRGALTQDEVDNMVRRYQDRYLIYRSEVIARTESIDLLHIGNSQLWRQAVRDGTITADEMVRWWFTAKDGPMIAAGKSTVCDLCREVPILNPNGVGVFGQFITPNGPVDGPTLHPQCRCVVFTRPRLS